MTLLRRGLPGPLVFVLLALTACDSDGNDGIDPGEVAGVYTFSEFAFNPAGTGIISANVLSRLNAQDTELELYDSGEFVLTYRIQGQSRIPLGGTFTVTEDRVTLRFREGVREQASRILLGDDLRLTRVSSATLTAQVQKTVNLDAYDPGAYQGVGSVPGTLSITLNRQ